LFIFVNNHLFTFVITTILHMKIEHLKLPYQHYREPSLSGRYINLDHLRMLLNRHRSQFEITVVGQSVLNEDIHFITLGSGKTKILMWSQMHGNESTTTKALFDLLNVLSDRDSKFVRQLLENVTIGILPMLNPDGARAYTRVNANQVDLNRDAQALTQPESKVLRNCFDAFKPNYCFNLHGQRTIFSAGATNKSAALSFLSPAQDEPCTITETRRRAMDVVVRMNDVLQRLIPGQIGTYDDAFNINCVGDTFQTLHVPTILFEAGHYANDYQREEVRRLIFISLWTAIVHIALKDIQGVHAAAYGAIPRNEKLFYDIIIRNAKLSEDETFPNCDIGVQYQERLDGDQVRFIPQIVKISDLSQFYGHKEFDAKGALVKSENNEAIKEGIEIDFVNIDHNKYPLNVEIN